MFHSTMVLFQTVSCIFYCVTDQDVTGDIFLSLTDATIKEELPQITFGQRRELMKVVTDLSAIKGIPDDQDNSCGSVCAEIILKLVPLMCAPEGSRLSLDHLSVLGF